MLRGKTTGMMMFGLMVIVAQELTSFELVSKAEAQTMRPISPKQEDRRSRWLGHGCIFHAALIETRGGPGMQTRRFGSYPSRAELSLSRTPR